MTGDRNTDPFGRDRSPKAELENTTYTRCYRYRLDRLGGHWPVTAVLPARARIDLLAKSSGSTENLMLAESELPRARLTTSKLLRSNGERVSQNCAPTTCQLGTEWTLLGNAGLVCAEARRDGIYTTAKNAENLVHTSRRTAISSSIPCA